MSYNRGCGRDFCNDRFRYDNRELFDALSYSPNEEHRFGPHRGRECRREHDRFNRYPNRHR